MKANIALGLAAVAVIIAAYGLFGHTTASFGAATTGNTTNYTALTVDTGPFTVTTTDTATSTSALGCIQTTATSTATPVRIVLGNNVIASTTYRGINAVGNVFWQYGNCP